MRDPEPPGAVTFCRRHFSAQKIALVRQVSAEFAAPGVTEVACTTCELLDWKRLSGRLKNHECRQLLEWLHDQGWLRLPALRPHGPRGPRRALVTAAGDPQALVPGRAGEYELLALQSLVSSGAGTALRGGRPKAASLCAGLSRPYCG